MTTSYIVEADGSDAEDLSPPLVSEAAAHDWAAANRRGLAYRIHVDEDGDAVGRPERFEPRPS